MAESSPQPFAVLPDAAGCIPTDLACLNCGYNLRSLSIAGNCPECGEAVLTSARGDFLCYAPPEWVRDLVSGITQLVFALGALLVASFSFISLVLTQIGSAEWFLIPGALALLVALLIGFSGLIFVTRSSLRFTQRPEGFGVRRALRGVLWTTAVLIGAGFGDAAGFKGCFWFWIGSAGMLQFGLPILLILYLKALLRRVPAPQLVAETEVFLLITCIFGGLVVPMTLFGVLLGGLGTGVCGVILLASGAFCSFAALLVFLIRVRQVFQQAAEDAEANARGTRSEN